MADPGVRRADVSRAPKEDVTVESLLRYAAALLESHGIAVRPSQLSRFIRKMPSPAHARDALDIYLSRRVEGASWAGFELFVNGYADPTGAHAARNVDNERREQWNSK